MLSGQDLLKRDEQKKLWDVIYKHEPDLITLAMPCGPWCSWMYLCDPDKVAEKRAEDLPLWRLARKVWDHQVRMKRLVLTEQPLGSEALRLTFMQERPKLYRVKLAQCMFGSADAVSGKPHRKLTALDVNDQYFADQLSLGSVCMHHPDEHQPLEGKVQVDGKWVNRSALAAAWPLPLCKHILKSAEKTLTRVQEIPPWHLARENEADDTMWETMPVASGQVPEQQLRKTLADLGATADRYGFVTFEGAGQQAPRRIRAAVAHLHVTLGHVANDRLVRMLTLSGAGNQILTVASNLRCQICAMVHPPRDAPQVSGNRPQNFNEKLSGDTFYVWDITNDKFAVLHYVDGLTDYQVADCSIGTNSIVAAELLRNCWYSIFGTPDVLVTDGGTEFSGAVQSLNELMGVIHEVVPEGAKWRLGHAERHGAILKLMIMKMVKSHNLKGYTEMRLAVTAAVMAKNRLANNGGVSPLQAVTGRNNVIPSSLMNQICSGKMRYVLNHAISRDECVQRAERIRAAAVESYLWLDSHDTLRKALASKSRPPKLELIREGATVYIYDPPACRRGLARRLQDNSSWSGPGTVVCVERDKNVPTRVWVRIRSKVKGVALERIRLATIEEICSNQFVTEALEEVQKELTSGKLRLTADSQAGEQEAQPMALEDVKHVDDVEDEEMITDQMRLERRLLTDVPFQMTRRNEAAEDPALMPFNKKQKLFDNLSKQLGAPTKLQEMQLRDHLEDAYGKVKGVKKKLKQQKTEVRREEDSGDEAGEPVLFHDVDSFLEWSDSLPKPDRDDQAEVLSVGTGGSEAGESGSLVTDPDVDMPASEHMYQTFIQDTFDERAEDPLTTVDYHRALWADPGPFAEIERMEQQAKTATKEYHEAQKQGGLITGKERLEYNWNKLSQEWKTAYIPALVKAFKVYLDHQAIQGVTMGQHVDPRRILPSRMVLTNKGKEVLAEAELKARWVFGGHRDPDAGEYLTASPTVSLVGHNLLNFLAVQFGWEVIYEDVSAAFLQGRELPPGRDIYVKVPHGYPEDALQVLRTAFGAHCRTDLVKLTKGGFGLHESPRLWYLEYKQTLNQIGGQELRLVPGFFCFYHDDGRLRAMACIHVDDTRYAGDSTSWEIWDALHAKLNFGKKRSAKDGWQKFCGRFEKQDPNTHEMYYTMDEYCADIKLVTEREASNMQMPLTDYERKVISSSVGQLNWAARQCRFDLSYGTSHVQQLAGCRDPMALTWLNRLIRRAHKEFVMVIPQLRCEIDELIVLSVSDAAYAAQPNGGSQGGMLIALAHPNIQHGEAKMAVIEAQSSRLQRVVRCSMAAELSAAASAFEHGDYVRAVLAEVVQRDFQLRAWKIAASMWRHVMVLDAKVAYDAIASEVAPTDRKLIVDIAILRETLEDVDGNSFLRWVPGREIPGDGLTKWFGNGALEKVLTLGVWTLCDTPLAAELRRRVAERKRQLKGQQKGQRTTGVLC